jgi:hypothetical protein
MKLLKKYRQYIGRYDECRSASGRKCLRKCGFGPETESLVETVKPKKTKKKTTK